MTLRFPAGAEKAIVLLHGRGGSAGDILSLLDRAALSDVAAVAPEAPGQSWWPTSFLAPSARMDPFVAAGLAAVEAAIRQLEARRVRRSSIWLGGFSQGACLALEAYARIGEGLAGVFGFSGGLVGRADTDFMSAELYGFRDKELTYPGRRTGTVWLSVHERDPHIPRKRVEDSARALRALGASVEMRLHPGAGHAVLREDLEALHAALTGR